MSEKNNGGQAFPHEDRAEVWERAGMTLRDYFAAKALPIVAEQYSGKSDDDVASYAYDMADAMLRARSA